MEIKNKDFVHRTTLSQQDVIEILEAMEEYSTTSNQQSKFAKKIKKFHLMALKADAGFANPAYVRKGRTEAAKIDAKSLGFEEVAAKEDFDMDSFMKEMESKSGDRRKEDVPTDYTRRSTDTDSEAASALFSDLNDDEISSIGKF